MEQIQPFAETISSVLKDAFTTVEPIVTNTVGVAHDAYAQAYTQIEPHLATAYTSLEPHLNTACDATANAYAQVQPNLASVGEATEQLLAPYVDTTHWLDVIPKAYQLAWARDVRTSAFADEGLSDSPFPWTHAIIPTLACAVYLLLVTNLMPKGVYVLW